MIEITILEFLSGKLSVPVYSEFPADPPDRFVVLDRSTGSRENRIDSTMFLAQSYGPSKFETAKLNHQVKAAMDSLIELDEIVEASLNSDYPFPDTKRNRHRYQAVYDITYY